MADTAEFAREQIDLLDRAEIILSLTAITQVYGDGESAVHALKGIDLEIHRGEHVAIMGPSGSGKSTVMNVLGCLDVATSGSYLLDGVNVDELDEHDLAHVRNRKIGFVFQSFNLIPRMSAQANVELPLVYGGVGRAERHERAAHALDRVGLAQRATHLPQQLSGGQQQRVAIARALVTEPAIVLADEPTGNLDNQATGEVLDLFDELAAAGKTIVMITHEDDVAERADRVLTLSDGRILDDRATGALS
ncbi:ABC transporter ATP-binding protein [Pseudoclavibacter sp. 13-3]|nr:ABC transporter ATP-binding protein [Pseudoclavibacter sp. 13-3]MCD7101417.1 ABC transporter ATP-binding protein [Pseudoclavibacter sp. 13-3]